MMASEEKDFDTSYDEGNAAAAPTRDEASTPTASGPAMLGKPAQLNQPPISTVLPKIGGGRRNKVCLEIMPKWSIIIVFALFVLVFGITVLIGALTGPKRIYVTEEYEYNLNTTDVGSIFHGDTVISSEVHGLKSINHDVYFVLLLNSAVSDKLAFTKSDLQFGVTLYGKNNGEELWGQITATNNTITSRTLTCPQSKDKTPGMPCNALTLIRESHIRFNSYKIDIEFRNLDYFWDMGFFEPTISSGFSFIDPAYATYELVWRYIFCVASIILLVVYIISCVVCLRFKARPHTEQWWVIILMIFLVMFNNPIYVLEFTNNSWVFPLINSIFLSNFVSVLLISVLIFVHSILKPPHERTLIKFYIPKFILVGLIWGMGVAFFAWTSIKTKSDPGYDAGSTIPFYRYIQYTWYALICVYAFLVLFYGFRIIGVVRKLRITYTLKFISLTFLTILLIVFAFVGVLVSMIFDLFDTSAIYVLYRALFNYYVFTFAWLFAPTRKPDETDGDPIESRSMIHDVDL